MHDREYAAIMDRLIDGYPDPPELTRLEVYRAALVHLPADALAAAVARAIGELKWFPTVAELREFARQHLELTGALPPAGMAWEAARRACNAYVPRLREKVAYPNAAIEECIRRMGGPRVIAHSELEDLEWRRKEFLSLYADISLQAEMLGSSLSLDRPRYILIYPSYVSIDGEMIGQGEPRVIDTASGDVVAPEFLQVEALTRGQHPGSSIPPHRSFDPFGAVGTGRGDAGGGSPRAIPRTTGRGDHPGDV